MKGSDSWDGLKPVHPHSLLVFSFFFFLYSIQNLSPNILKKIHSENTNQLQLLSDSATGKIIFYSALFKLLNQIHA